MVSRVGIIGFVGGRDAEAEARLQAALARAPYTAIRSLRRNDEPSSLAGDGWWLSTAPVSEDDTGIQPSSSDAP